MARRQTSSIRASSIGASLRVRTCGVLSVVGRSVRFMTGCATGCPIATPSRSMGEMDQATAVFDDERSAGVHDFQGAADRSAAVRGLAESDPGAHRDRGSAVLRSPRIRSRPHRLGGAGQHAPRPRARRAAARITQQLARQSFLTPDKTYPPQAAGADPRGADRAAVHEGADSRAVSEQGVFRRRVVRRRGGGARLFRQARLGARRRRGGAARRPGEVAVELRADRQHARARSRAATSCCRRCSRAARSIAPTWQAARASEGRAATTACGPTSRTASTSRSRCGSELVERFGWQRVYQGGLRVFSTIDMPMQHAAEAAVADRSKSIDARRDAGGSTRAARQKTQAPVDRDARRPAAGGAGRARSGDRPRARDGRRPRFRREPLQSRRAGASPARLGVQAVRLRGGARGGLHAGDGDRSSRRSDRDAAGRVDAGGRALDGARR